MQPPYNTHTVHAPRPLITLQMHTRTCELMSIIGGESSLLLRLPSAEAVCVCIYLRDLSIEGSYLSI